MLSVTVDVVVSLPRFSSNPPCNSANRSEIPPMVQINVRPLRPQKSQCTQTVRNLHEAPDLSAPHHIAPSRNIAAIRIGSQGANWSCCTGCGFPVFEDAALLKFRGTNTRLHRLTSAELPVITARVSIVEEFIPHHWRCDSVLKDQALGETGNDREGMHHGYRHCSSSPRTAGAP